MSQSAPQPSAEAMAAAKEIDRDAQDPAFFFTEGEAVASTATIIDRHFAPLRAENAKLREALREAHNCLARLVLLLEAAGISRLSEAVQFGEVSWYHKCHDATEWAKQIIAARAERDNETFTTALALANKAIAELERDKARLDWLGSNCTRVSDSERYLPKSVYWGGGTHRNVRAAIDAAMTTKDTHDQGTN